MIKLTRLYLLSLLFFTLKSFGVEISDSSFINELTPAHWEYSAIIEVAKAERNIDVPEGIWSSTSSYNIGGNKYHVVNTLFVTPANEFSLIAEVWRDNESEVIKSQASGNFRVKGAALIAENVVGNQVLLGDLKIFVVDEITQQQMKIINVENISQLLTFKKVNQTLSESK